MAFKFSPRIVTDGLVLYLDAANERSYNGFGTTWYDLSPSKNNGTLVNGVQFNDDNNYFTFNGTSNYVSTTYNAQLTDFTICLWFKPGDSTNNTSARLIDKNYQTGFWLGKNAATGEANSWGGGVKEGSPYGIYLTLLDTQWNFLVSVRSGTTHTLYGNGITNTTSNTVSATALDTTIMTIGTVTGFNPQQCFKGNIAVAQVYDRALSSTEVLQNYNALKTRFGLVKEEPDTRANVKTYGAVGNGVANDTAAIQQAINENANIYIPTGNYLVDTLVLKTNTNILGDGMGKSILTRRYVDSSINPFDCLMLATSNSEQTKVSNIKINSLTFYGQSDVYNFSEFVHLLYLVGTDNVTVTNCEFKAFRGDGICLGGVSLYNSTYFNPRHNSNVTISNCVFNGVNKENRNGISIIDCTGLLVENCEFKNSTRSNMPGAIDFEPDLYFQVIQNCTIRNNTFTNIGGNAGVIGMLFKDINYTTFPSTFLIQSNSIADCTNTDGTLFYVYKRDNSSLGPTDGQSNVTWSYNTITNVTKSLLINNSNGILVENCSFSNVLGTGYIPYRDNDTFKYSLSRNVNIVSCSFENCGKTEGNGLSISNVNNLLISQSQFTDCGTGNVGYSNAINFISGSSSYVKIKNTTFSKTDKTLVAIQKTNHIFSAATNEFTNNTLNGLPSYFEYPAP
jgi:hypothetical protein